MISQSPQRRTKWMSTKALQKNLLGQSKEVFVFYISSVLSSVYYCDYSSYDDPQYCLVSRLKCESRHQYPGWHLGSYYVFVGVPICRDLGSIGVLFLSKLIFLFAIFLSYDILVQVPVVVFLFVVKSWYVSQESRLITSLNDVVVSYIFCKRITIRVSVLHDYL